MARALASRALITFAVSFLIFACRVHHALAQARNSPQGMVLIPGGEFAMGSRELTATTCPILEGMRLVADAQPVHQVSLESFWMDETEVTNEQFAEFVNATRYVTVAERGPSVAEMPQVVPEARSRGGAVFIAVPRGTEINDSYQWWTFREEANWRHPEGPGSTIHGKEKHPVVQITFIDAEAYAKWAGKRLPTEAEFEFAARGGLKGALYPWGNEFMPHGRYLANTYQGDFPYDDSGADGYKGTAPVKSYPANAFGLYDMAGNVWEWCADWYHPNYYQELARQGVARAPAGPSSSSDPQEPGVVKRVHRGGSFLCTDQYCSRYKVGTRGKGEPYSPTNHLGFRCVRSANDNAAQSTAPKRSIRRVAE